MATFKPIAINENNVTLPYNEGQYIVATKPFSDGTNSYEAGVYVDMLGGRQQLTMQGPQGVQGERGPQGERGLQGVQGVQGVRGPAGTNGRSYEINGQVDSADQLPAPAATYLGEAWYVGTDMPRDVYACVEHDGTLVWENQGKLQGPQGEQGPQGVQGEQGPQGVQGLGLNWKGEWHDGVEVNKNDAFSYNGSSFVAQADNVIGPPVENENWGIIAEKGEKGATGATGPRGQQGMQGPRGYGLSPRNWLIEVVDDGGAFPNTARFIVDGQEKLIRFDEGGEEFTLFGAVIGYCEWDLLVSPQFVTREDAILARSASTSNAIFLAGQVQQASVYSLMSISGENEIKLKILIN